MDEGKKPEVSKDSPQDESSQNKKIKNLISISILLAGLFAGSLFVDFAQMIRGGGFSFGRLSNADVFESQGKTWVSYSEPIVNVKVINDESCESCNPDDALLSLKTILPTLLTEKVDQNSSEGQKMVSDLGIKAIPAFVFGKDLENTDFYLRASAVLDKEGDMYVLNTAQVGIPVGKYLELPSISDSDIKIGSDDAKVKIIEFSDFQCPYCKALHPTITKALSEYKDQIQLVYKQFPLSNIHPQALNAALASECANEQGKFLDYADKLFEDQSTWGATTGVQSFKNYAAQMGLSSSQFASCLDSKKYQNKVDEDLAEGQKFGISGTPDIFINSQFQVGAIDYETLKGIIDQELKK